MSRVDLGQIFTRRIVADYMVSLFTLPVKSVVLDPCFGEGVFLRSLDENTEYSQVGYEIDPTLFGAMQKQNRDRKPKRKRKGAGGRKYGKRHVRRDSGNALEMLIAAYRRAGITELAAKGVSSCKS